MKIILFLISLSISFGLQAQKRDYKKVRDEILSPACKTVLDSSEVFGTIQRLEEMDTNIVRKNLHVYYEDLGQYYWLASGKGNNNYLNRAVDALHSALYHQPHSRKALWDLAFVYGFLYECDTARAYFKEYHKYTPLEYASEYSTQQENELLAKCESKN